MKFIIEGKWITEETLRDIIPSKFLTVLNNGEVKCDYVGYLRVSGKEPIFLLPKIFPEGLICKYDSDSGVKKRLAKYMIEQYLALRKYKSNNSEKGLLPDDIKESGEITYLDAALAIVNFYNKHKYLNQVIKADIYERQIGKVNWNKLINRGKYLVMGDEIFFDIFPNTRNIASNEDFLLKLLFREIYEINNEIGGVNIDSELPTLSNKEYNLFKKKPVKILKALKKRYFRDEFIKLIKLLINYYTIDKATDGKGKCEYLLTSSFQNIFEAMVDNFISDKMLLRKYKFHKDGKIIDHIFEYKDIINLGKIIYVGDSKYYKDVNAIQNTRWKQFTYINNIQNIIINERNNNILNEYSNYLFDEIFRSYNIIPNFFISAYIEEVNHYENNTFIKVTDNIEPLENYHLKNMIFDRDTLNIFYYEINLEFLIKSYIYGFNQKQQIICKDCIRNNIKEFYNKNYKFYKIKGNIRENINFVKTRYYYFEGKVIYLKAEKIMILALRKDKYDSENKRLLKEINKNNIEINEIEI